MMKKLLVLMLVLGLAATASALPVGFSLKVAYDMPDGSAPPAENYFDPVDSELYLLPSQTLWIGIYNSTAGVKGQLQKPMLMLGIVQPPQGSANTVWLTDKVAQYKGAPGDPQVEGVSPPFYRGDPLVEGAPANEYLGITDFWDDGSLYVDLWLSDLSDGKPDTGNDIGVLDAKDLHCEFGPSDDTIILWSQDAEELDRIVIHQIPEPATIALLGLGGLMLRRRKK
jgi:hypothetical protein